MSKIKLTGHASGTGTLTLTGPNTSTDRTITLPDATGTLTFTPSITDGGNATAITIDSSEKIGINETSPACVSKGVHITTASVGTLPTLQADADDLLIENSTPGITLMGQANGGGMLAFGDVDDADIGNIFYYHVDNSMSFKTNTAEQLKITSDGRGLSQFTAKAWCNFNGSASIRDSHNISSVTDNGTGDFSMNFANDMANNDYVPLTGQEGGFDVHRYNSHHTSDASYYRVNVGYHTTGSTLVVADLGYNFYAFFGD